MAHATMRHVTRTLTTYQGLNIFGTAASIGLGTGVGAEAEQIFANVFTVGVNLYLPGYSRKYEREADQVGFYYMSKAGYNPQAAIDIWQKAAKRGGSNAKKTDFFASHPANGERAKSLNGWLEDAESVKSGARSENGPPCRHREKRSDVAIQSGLLRYARNDDHKINK